MPWFHNFLLVVIIFNGLFACSLSIGEWQTSNLRACLRAKLHIQDEKKKYIIHLERCESQVFSTCSISIHPQPVKIDPVHKGD